jgi:AraC-like DNA-binding protein
MILYLIPAALRLYTLLRDKTHSSRKELKIVFSYISLVIFFGAMMLLAGIIRNDLLNLTSIYSLTILAVWYFIFSFRYPDFTQKAIREAKVIRYKKSILNSINSDVVIERMEELMKDEKKFLDSELTLQKLSEELMVTVHQLSKILNSKHGVNFPTFVNSHRVKESKNLMKQFPDKNILEIALESGFNSKSSFNSAFSKETGLTPRNFRKSLKELE